jgi:hypothetical protein
MTTTVAGFIARRLLVHATNVDAYPTRTPPNQTALARMTARISPNYSMFLDRPHG